MQGRSLVPLLAGKDPDAVSWRRRPITATGSTSTAPTTSPPTGAAHPDRKLVHYYGSGCDQPGASTRRRPASGSSSTSRADPEELHSVHDDPAYADDVRRLTEALDRLAPELGDDVPPNRAQPNNAATPPDLAPHTKAGEP